ncbi:hypothetical protein PWT90_07162 [Aphanocladium album]|nr:hypothetical protein PWT90_07162 [Aphanocladium album]
MADTYQHERLFDFPPSGFLGTVLRPGDNGFEEARKLPNARIENTPAVIARCATENDVLLTVKYCAAHNEPMAIRAGGHTIDGHAMPDDAFVIDVSLMRNVEVDKRTGITTVEAGALIRDMDSATQAYGMVVPSGTVSSTGVAGLTLGGGMGYLTRLHGMAVDNLLAVDVITVDGRRLAASATENSDLFWGLRGAGHNLAIALRFVFQAHKIGPEVLSGHIIYPAGVAPQLLSQLHIDMQQAARELTIYSVLLPAPPLKGLSAQLIGHPVLVLLLVYVGALREFQQVMATVRPSAVPVAEEIQVSSWMRANSVLDALTPPGRRQHSRGGYLAELGYEMIQKAVELLDRAPISAGPGPSVAVAFPCLGGANGDVNEDSMAYSRKGAFWLFECYASNSDRSGDEAFAGWVEEGKMTLSAYSLSNAYINLSCDNGPKWLSTAYGSPEKWDKLCQLKMKYDPKNLLCHNKNTTRARLALAKQCLQ